jgi:hypothetical protein
VATQSTMGCGQGSGTSSPLLGGVVDRVHRLSPRGAEEVEEDMVVLVMPSTKTERWQCGGAVALKDGSDGCLVH